MPTKRKAVFLDRDGVINHSIDRGPDFSAKGKNVRWTAPFRHDELQFKEGVVNALTRLGELGFLRILVTNQPDVGYGLMDETEYRRIMDDIRQLPFDDIFVCRHGRDEGCVCKKPKPGMLLQAAERHEIDLTSSFFIGDMQSDVDAGQAAGCTVILLDAEYNRQVESAYRETDLRSAILRIEQSYSNHSSV